MVIQPIITVRNIGQPLRAVYSSYNYPLMLSITVGSGTLVYTESLQLEGLANENGPTKIYSYLANAEGKTVAYLEIDPNSRRLNIKTYNSDGTLESFSI